MLYLGTTEGVVRVDPETGRVARLGPADTSVEALAVAAETIVAAVTPDYGVPMRNPLRPGHARGAVRSTDSGRTWSPVEGLAGQQVTALAALEALDGGFAAGTDPAEMLRSDDAGVTWRRGQSLREMPGYDAWTYPGVPHTPHVMLIAPHPTETGTLYAGIEVGGIVRSTDGGATWRVIGSESVHPDIHGIAISPSSPAVAYAATPRGVYRSSDGGETWEHRSEGLERLYCRPIVVHQEDPDRAVVVCTHGASGFFGIPAERTGGMVYVTDDGGKAWRHVTRGVPEQIQPTPSMVPDPVRAGRFYLPLFSGELLVTDDGGDSWREAAAGLPPILRVAAPYRARRRPRGKRPVTRVRRRGLPALAAVSLAGGARLLSATSNVHAQAFPISVLPVDILSSLRLIGTAARDASLERVLIEPPADGAALPFAQALRIRTDRQPLDTWLIQLNVRTVTPIEKDDALLATYWARGVAAASETGEARTELIFERATDPYTKSASAPVGVPAGGEWRLVQLPFRAAERYGVGEAQVNLRLGYQPQTIEISGLSVMNYGKTVTAQDLPRSRATYAGRDPSAAWRAAAAERIDSVRKGDLVIAVVDEAGRPVPRAGVSIRQQRHAFGFGSAVAAANLTGRGSDNERYQEIVARVFSKVVLENDLKWPNWEDATQRPRTMQALAWLREHGITIRGHNLVWPSWRYLPPDVQRLRDNAAALRQRVATHILDEAGTLAGLLVDWDVVNEPIANHDLMDILGNDALAEWFQLARQADPVARLVLNEATVPEMGARQEQFERTLRFLIDSGAPLGGIGFQCHYGTNVTPPAAMLPALDRFGALGLPIQITEFDVDTTDEALQADYVRDFLTAAFSHPAVESILMWGFWEGRHWRPDAALWRRDWSLKPNGEAWLDLVTQQWWTESSGQTDVEGVFRVRAFRGEHDVQVSGNGRTQQSLIRLDGDSAFVRITLA